MTDAHFEKLQSVSAQSTHKLTKRYKKNIIPGVLIGLAGAALAFSQAASTQYKGALDDLALAPFLDASHSLREVGVLETEGGRLVLSDPSRAEALALAAVRAAPLDPQPLLLLAVSHANDGRTTQAFELAKLAEKVSRRHAGSQFWLALQSLLAGNYPSGMDHIDRLLVVNPEMASQLFPVLTTSLTDLRFQPVLARKLAGDPIWKDDFLWYAASNHPNIRDFARVIQVLPSIERSPLTIETAELVFARLIEQGDLGVLHTIADRFDVQPKQGLLPLGLGGFQSVEGIVPLAWDLPANANFGAAIFSPPASRGFQLSAWVNPGYRGVVARKLAWVNPGRYRIAWSEQIVENSSDAEAHWRIECPDLNGSKQIAQSDNLFESADHGELTFSTPSGCSAVLISLYLSGPRDRSTAELRFLNVHASQL